MFNSIAFYLCICSVENFRHNNIALSSGVAICSAFDTRIITLLVKRDPTKKYIQMVYNKFVLENFYRHLFVLYFDIWLIKNSLKVVS